MFYQLFSLLILAFHQLHAVEYCPALASAMGIQYCESELFCMSDGSGGCELDENADVSLTAFDLTLCTGCSQLQHTYNGITFYFRYSTVRNSNFTINDCSLEYAYTADISNTPYCDTTKCASKNFGPDDNGQTMYGCFDYCWANPTDPTCICLANPNDPICYCLASPTDPTCICLANPDDSICYCLANPNDVVCHLQYCLANPNDVTTCQPCTNSSTVCCAVRESYSCATYCVNDGTQSTCCGGPSTHDTISTVSCGNYAQRYASDLADVTRCKNDPKNLTACAMCSSYYQCCSQYKNVTISGYICDDFCALKPSDEGCTSRKKCLESVGSNPTDADYTRCGTSVVRLSSICVALLLGLIGFFVGL